MKFLKNRLSLILAAIFIVSLAYAFYFQIVPVVDAKAYDNIAVNLVQHGVFKENVDASYAKDMSIQRAGPGYEYFLATIFFVFGHHYELVWILQALLHTVTAYFIYLIATKIFKDESTETAALIAAIVFGLHPDLIEISAMLMTETLFLFFITLTMYLFVKVYEDIKSWRYSMTLGISLGLGILIRPTIVFFIPVILIAYLLKKQFARAAIMLIICVALLMPWVVRNFNIYHQFIPTTLIGEYNLWLGNTVHSDGGQLSGGYNPFDAYVQSHDYYTIHRTATQSFISFIIEYPGSFARLSFVRFIRYFSLLRPMGFWFYQTGLGQIVFIACSGLAIALLFILGIAGATKLWKKNPLYRYIIALAITSPLPLLITVVQSRYRFPLYPFLALFAGYLLAYAYKTKNWWKEKAVAVPTILLLIISLIDLSASLGTIIERIKSLI